MSQASQLTVSEKEDACNRIVRYILNMMGSRIPIRKTEIVKNVLNKKSKSYNEIIKMAKDTLEELYGFELFEIPDESVNKQYIVLNKLNSEPPIMDRKEKSQYTLLFFILTHIFMSGGSASEESVYTFLHHLKLINGDNYQNDRFGDIKQLITVDFPKMLYLNHGRSENYSQPGTSTQLNNKSTLITWGWRAQKELKKEKILLFMSEIYGRDMKTWTSRYKEVELEKNTA